MIATPHPADDWDDEPAASDRPQPPVTVRPDLCDHTEVTSALPGALIITDEFEQCVVLCALRGRLRWERLLEKKRCAQVQLVLMWKIRRLAWMPPVERRGSSLAQRDIRSAGPVVVIHAGGGRNYESRAFSAFLTSVATARQRSRR